MATSGRIERRLAAAIVLTALIPLLAALYLARLAVERTSERFYKPEVGTYLDEALNRYQELARADKAAMRSQAAAMALDPKLARALSAGEARAIEAELRRMLSAT